MFRKSLALAAAAFWLACGIAAAQTPTFTGVLSGTWWDPARSGEGQLITFETVGTRNVVFFAWFTYNSTGQASWLVGNVDYTPGATSITIPVFTASGARFGNDFRAGDVQTTPMGTVVLQYVSCNQLRLAFSGSQTFSLTLSRLVGPLTGTTCVSAAAPPSATDNALRPLLAGAGQTGDARLGRRIPSIDEPLPQLGKLLFFSKTLSGNLDTACASCHHPALAGADGLSLSIGTGATSPNVLGVGRTLASGGFSTPRNTNTFFNVVLWDSFLFWDGRVESIGKLRFANGENTGIRTPDSTFGTADPAAGPNLPAAQARFPIVAPTEMKGPAAFPGMTDNALRAHLAARIGDYGTGTGALRASQWLQRFRTAFASPAGSAQQLITLDNIALAIAEYQRSATFVDTPWARYVRGENGAIGEEAKQGALLFFRPVEQGGANCALCHRNDAFSDERFRAVGFPQVGPGQNDGGGAGDDFGRGRQSGRPDERYFWRTPSLLNVELTAPYGHAGAYGDLATVVSHYVNPDATVDNFLGARTWCSLPQFAPMPGCAATAADVARNSRAALDRMKAVGTQAPADSMPRLDPARFPPDAVARIVEFMKALTDPCLRDRGCFGRWIPAVAEAPDEHQLNAVNASGNPL
jgi:cytochrome c peroxidase